MTAPTYKLDPASIDDLGMGELVDACDAAGIEVADIKAVTGNARLRLYLAIAWIIARRDKPTLTWGEMQRARLEVVAPATIHPIERQRSKRTASG